MISRDSEFRRGWRVLLAASLGTACGASPVPFFAIGLFALPLGAAFGWGRGDVMLAVLPMTFGIILVVPFIGALADRVGVRPVAMATLVGLALSFAALSLTPDSLPVFYFLWFMVGLLGGGSTPVSWTRGVVGWFVHNRGMALAITLMATGVTGALLPRYVAWLVEVFGWRLAFVGVALIPVVIALPVAWRYFHEAPRQMADPMAGVPDNAAIVLSTPAGRGKTLGEALRDYRFWVLAVVVLLATLQTGGAITNFAPLLQDRGYTVVEAASIAGVIGLSIVVGRVLTGYLIDRFWAPGVAFPLLAAPAIACLLLVQPEVGTGAAIAAAIMIGLASGAETDLIAYLTARYFGLRHYGRIYGVQYAVFGFAGGISPFIFGRVFDVTGSYNLVLYASAIMVVAAACLLLTMGRYPDRSAQA